MLLTQVYGETFAAAAPGGELQETFPFEADGRKFYYARVQFGGNTCVGGQGFSWSFAGCFRLVGRVF